MEINSIINSSYKNRGNIYINKNDVNYDNYVHNNYK